MDGMSYCNLTGGLGENALKLICVPFHSQHLPVLSNQLLPISARLVRILKAGSDSAIRNVMSSVWQLSTHSSCTAWQLSSINHEASCLDYGFVVPRSNLSLLMDIVDM